MVDARIIFVIIDLREAGTTKLAHQPIANTIPANSTRTCWTIVEICWKLYKKLFDFKVSSVKTLTAIASVKIDDFLVETIQFRYYTSTYLLMRTIVCTYITPVYYIKRHVLRLFVIIFNPR